MSDTTHGPAAFVERGDAPAAGSGQTLGVLASLPGAVTLAFIIGVLFDRAQIIAVWRHGFFADTDDAMRLAQTRAWLNGQGWFDLRAHLLGPAPGTLMHWSRLVDVPIGLLLRLFGLAFSPDTAERLTRITLPLALYALLLVICLDIVRRLLGPAAVLIAAIGLALSGAAEQYFQAGRLDHDHIAIVLMVATLALQLRAFDAEAHLAAWGAGFLAALQLAVSLETLPFVMVSLAALPLAYLVLGAPIASNLRRFSVALMLGLALGFLATVPVSRYFVAACDDYSVAHLVPGLLGAGLCLGLAGYAPEPRAWLRRAMAGLGCGAAVIASVGLLFPQCLGSPLDGMDPFLRHIWLPYVSEARPFLVLLQKSPHQAAIYIPPVLLGFSGAVWAAVRFEGTDRLRWVIISLMIATGIAITFWASRGIGEVMPLAMLGFTALLTPLAERLIASGKAMAGVLVIALCLTGCPMIYALAWPATPKLASLRRAARAAACDNAEAFTAIAALPRGTILTPFDIGAMFLARTKDRIIAAPFHRDAFGMKASLAAFRATPDVAKVIVATTGANYLAYCPGTTDIRFSGKGAPASLASQLEAGNVPSWLTPLRLATPFRVFRINIP